MHRIFVLLATLLALAGFTALNISATTAAPPHTMPATGMDMQSRADNFLLAMLAASLLSGGGVLLPRAHSK